MYDDDDDYFDDGTDYEDEVGQNSRDYEDDGCDFADPGGNSALRRATKANPRNRRCPNCGEPNRLTPRDVSLGYQCDSCADMAERGGY
jgi:hypothetical protein